MNNNTKFNIIRKNSSNVSIGLMTEEEMKEVVEKIEYYYGPAHAFECYRFMVSERRKLGLSYYIYSNSEQKKLEDKDYRESCIVSELREHYSRFCQRTTIQEAKATTIEDKPLLQRVASFLPKFMKHK